MDDSILSSPLSKSRVNFYDADTGRELWARLGVVRVQFINNADVTDHPFQITTKTTQTTESEGQAGTTVEQDLSQAKIITPTSVHVEAISLSADVTGSLLSAFDSDTLLINIISKSVIAESLAIENIRLVSSPKIVSGQRVYIDLKQAFPPESTTADQPEQAADAREYGTGIKQPQESGPALEDLYDNMVGGI